MEMDPIVQELITLLKTSQEENRKYSETLIEITREAITSQRKAWELAIYGRTDLPSAESSPTGTSTGLELEKLMQAQWESPTVVDPMRDTVIREELENQGLLTQLARMREAGSLLADSDTDRLAREMATGSDSPFIPISPTTGLEDPDPS